nr:hypothetical protein [Abyssogena phaseoliformis symbiont]
MLCWAISWQPRPFRNHWAGVVIYGFIRDAEIINSMPISVRALGVHPLKSVKKNRRKTHKSEFFRC